MLQSNLTAANKEKDRFLEYGQEERKYRTEAETERYEAKKKQQEAEEREQHKSLQLSRIAVALVTYMAFLAILNKEPILDSLREFIGRIQAHTVPYGIAGVVAVCLIGFALINQQKERTKKKNHDRAVWDINAAFLIVLGAVTGFYEYVPYLTYPECIIWLVVAYQSIKMAVKMKHTY